METTRKQPLLQFFCLLMLGIGLTLTACHTRKLASEASTYDENHSEPASIIVLPLQEAELRTRYAAILGINTADLKDIKIYYFIDQWIGTPYLNGGTTHMGIDCSAFSQSLYREVNHILLPRTSLLQSNNINEKDKSGLVEGDLVFFSSGHNQIDHVGVYLGNNKFVHASTSKGVTISDLNQNWYQRNYVKGGSIQ